MSNTRPRADQGALDDDLSLLDLPLQGEADAEDDLDDTDAEPAFVPPQAETGPSVDDDFDDEEDSGADAEESELFGDDLDLSELEDGGYDDVAQAVREADARGDEQPAPLQDRILAGLADLLIQCVAIGAAVFGVRLMDVGLSLDLWIPFAVLSTVFSFLYWFIPLAFWGQTPGMGWMGQQALSLDDQPLSFAQTALRWCGALLTLGFVGLPLLLALTGRSFTDRLSDSKTIQL